MKLDDLTSQAIGHATKDFVGQFLERYPEYRPPDRFMDRIERFAAELALWGTKFNLTAAPDDPAELAFHIGDSLIPILIAAREPDSLIRTAFHNDNHRMLDLGSGAGFPAIVLAAATEAEFTLAESRRKRANFLRVAVTALRLTNVHIDSQHRSGWTPEFDVVTARAFARPETFYTAARTALKPGGVSILYASIRQENEIVGILRSRGEVFDLYDYDPPPHANVRAAPEGKAPHRHLLVVSSGGS